MQHLVLMSAIAGVLPVQDNSRQLETVNRALMLSHTKQHEEVKHQQRSNQPAQERSHAPVRPHKNKF